MARIRSIKPQFFGSGTTSRLSLEARLVAIGLISMADDDGRLFGSVKAISAYVFPHDDIPAAKITKWLRELTSEAYLVLYEVDGLQYGWLPKFREHQRINKPTPSTLPPPPSAESLRTLSRSGSTPTTQGKGMERGMEGNGERNGEREDGSVVLDLRSVTGETEGQNLISGDIRG